MNGQLERALSRRPSTRGSARGAEVRPADVDVGGWPVLTRWIRTGQAQHWPEHRHDLPELIWDATGTVAVATGSSIWFVPPSAGLWLPAGTPHEVLAAAGAAFACTWISADVPPRPATTLVRVGAIAREALRELGEPGVTPALRDRLTAVIFDFVTDAPGPGELSLPADPRALAVARALLDDPADGRPLADWARTAHSSVRTLSRLFVEQTGLTFAAWRTELRLRHSLALLAAGQPVATVADRVGYQSVSAFSTAFRRSLGHSPGGFARSRIR